MSMDYTEANIRAFLAAVQREYDPDALADILYYDHHVVAEAMYAAGLIDRRLYERRAEPQPVAVFGRRKKDRRIEMHGHPANRLKNIEAQRRAGVDPKVGEWPGDEGYVPPASEGELSERSDPSPSEAVRAAAARSVVEEFVKLAIADQSPEELERVATECNDVSRTVNLEHDEVLRDIAASIHASVQALNVFVAEAARRGVSVRVSSRFASVKDARARPIRLEAKLTKVV